MIYFAPSIYIDTFFVFYHALLAIYHKIILVIYLFTYHEDQLVYALLILSLVQRYLNRLWEYSNIIKK